MTWVTCGLSSQRRSPAVSYLRSKITGIGEADVSGDGFSFTMGCDQITTWKIAEKHRDLEEGTHLPTALKSSIFRIVVFQTFFFSFSG